MTGFRRNRRHVAKGGSCLGSLIPCGYAGFGFLVLPVVRIDSALFLFFSLDKNESQTSLEGPQNKEILKLFNLCLSSVERYNPHE